MSQLRGAGGGAQNRVLETIYYRTPHSFYNTLEVKSISDTVLNLSFSKMKCWRRCRQEFHYKYVDKLERKLPAVPLVRGNIIHECINAWMNRRDWREVLAAYVSQYEKLFAEERDLYGDLPTDIEQIMENYTRKYQNDPFEYPAVELPFSVHLFGNVNFTGRIDALARDRDKGLWVMETKTHKKLPDDDVRLLNVQAVFYAWAVPHIEGYEEEQVKGILWNYIRTKPPAIPEVLKNGTLSKRKNIDTDYHTYLKAVRENGEDPNKYADILQKLEEQTDRFFRRIYFPKPSPTLVFNIMRDVEITANEILAYLGSDEEENWTGPFRYRNLNPFQCKNCSYRPLCEAELFDMDVEFVKRTMFQPRVRPDENAGPPRLEIIHQKPKALENFRHVPKWRRKG